MLSDLFNYDPDTGLLTWKVSRTNRVKVGQVAGSVQTNHSGKDYQRKYLHVRLAEGTFFVHHIAYEIMTGRPMPPGMEIDHRDGDGINNRWNNLRLATGSQNMGNRDRNRRRVRDLPKGVQWHERDQLYVARLAGRAVKYSKSMEEAKRAYDDAAARYYGEFTKGGQP